MDYPLLVMVEPSQAITLESLHDAVSNVLASDLQAYEDGGEYDGFAIGGRYARGAEPNIAIEQAFLNAAGAAGIPVGAPCAHGQYGELITLLHDLELDRLRKDHTDRASKNCACYGKWHRRCEMPRSAVWDKPRRAHCCPPSTAGAISHERTSECSRASYPRPAKSVA